jgi:drug/metabolite transporter (DMT)-like permease
VRVTWLIAVGLAVAALSALASNVGFLMRSRGATSAPDVDIRKPGRTVVGLFSEKWWTIGFGMAIIAWLLHVASLKWAPLSLVQAVLASGLVMMAVIAERFFGFKVGKREWIGISLVTAGLVLLGLTASDASASSAQAGYPLGAAIAFVGGSVGLAAVAFLLVRSSGGEARAGVLFGASAGLLFTVSHVGIKALSGQVTFADLTTFLTPWVLVIVAAFVCAFFASARSLQIGDAVPVIAVTSAISTATAILGGVVVFGDPIGSDALTIAVRVGAFLLVIVAAAVIPGPVRAAGQRRESGSESRGAPATASA